MKKYLIFILLCVALMSRAAYADAIYSILNAIQQLESIETGIQNTQIDILESQLDVEDLMKQVNSHLTGNSGWGNYQFHDYQSYGAGSATWADVARMAATGGSSGQLGQTMNALAGQFPIDSKAFNSGVSSAMHRNYYAMQSQTILAARAASQLDYDKIQDQIDYQQMLQHQIENTKDLKSAMDLNNRIQLEANLIHLEVLRQSAIANQQQALSGQANMNSALSNAKFLTKQ